MSHEMEDESSEPVPHDSELESLPDLEMESSQSSGEYDHDVAELFSRPRLVPWCISQGQLIGGPSVDIKTGVDLLVAKKRIETQRKLDKHRTKVVVLSPPCSRFSQIHRYFKKIKRPHHLSKKMPTHSSSFSSQWMSQNHSTETDESSSLSTLPVRRVGSWI